MIPAMPGPEIELTSFDGTRGSGREGDMSYSPANAMANVVPAVAMLRLPSQSHSDRPSAVQSLDDRFDVAGIGSSGEVQRESLMVTSSCMDMQASTEDTVDMADAPIAAKYRGRRPSMVELAVKQPADLTLQDKLQFQRLLLRLAKVLFLFGVCCETVGVL